ncbi:hypothetical protein Nepgr_004219 [Nepenthes gracilis]|uniref:Sec-independent protein translocase protein TatB n=1 Tax=Nepenthes gracilis TaxID=150966 RepID=A0AAD3S0Y2_NEPGR|nr:hypothetical protein Nepgr_004219 [Nepenthes gracilis]
MLGLSYGEIFLILGATAALIGPKDLPIIARTAGRLAGRAIGYVQLARGQFENVMQQTQFRQVNKELQDTIAQLEAIRYEIRSISIMNPGPLTRSLMDNPDQTNSETGVQGNVVPPNLEERNPLGGAQHHQHQSPKQAASVHKGHDSATAASSNLHCQATAFARLAESQSLKAGSWQCRDETRIFDDKPGLLSVLPVSAESAGLLENRSGETTGSDILLEAMLEAEVARNAKDFFSQPQNQI